MPTHSKYLCSYYKRNRPKFCSCNSLTSSGQPCPLGKGKILHSVVGGILDSPFYHVKFGKKKQNKTNKNLSFKGMGLGDLKQDSSNDWGLYPVVWRWSHPHTLKGQTGKVIRPVPRFLADVFATFSYMAACLWPQGLCWILEVEKTLLLPSSCFIFS